jgi:predicted nucleic acid-binding protein
MADKVVDASAICALIYDEPLAQDVLARISSGRLLAPSLLALEAANVCVTKLRTHRGSEDKILKLFAVFSTLSIAVSDPPMDLVVQAAYEQSLSAYDASYLVLAREHNAVLVTLDKRLMTAAGKIGVKT